MIYEENCQLDFAAREQGHGTNSDLMFAFGETDTGNFASSADVAQPIIYNSDLVDEPDSDAGLTGNLREVTYATREGALRQEPPQESLNFNHSDSNNGYGLPNYYGDMPIHQMQGDPDVIEFSKKREASKRVDFKKAHQKLTVGQKIRNKGSNMKHVKPAAVPR